MKIVNTHIHSPYSFSCFSSVKQATSLAQQQQVKVLGLSDFNTTDGFAEFGDCCKQDGIYPLYNIEYIALSTDDKERNLRWNDPKNPGIIYFCGKALAASPQYTEDSRNQLSSLWKSSQDHMWKMIDKVNSVIQELGLPLELSYSDILTQYARKNVRERHVAQAVFHAFEAQWSTEGERLESYKKLFGDSKFSGNIADSPFMQNEIRNRLLKAGKPAFVAEKVDAFLPLNRIKSLIVEAGGIPCYPVLADDSAPLNEYESDPVKLADTLERMNIYAVEFIPLRNSFDHLTRYVRTFVERGFCVTFGTEHNTPECISLVPAARGGQAFDDELNQVSYNGACILAAHQAYPEKCLWLGGKEKRVGDGKDVLKEMVRIGDELIRKTLS